MQVCQKTLTFGEFAEQWLDSRKGTVKDNTYNISYEIVVHKHLLPVFGSRELKSITVFELQDFVNGKAKSLANETVKKIRGRLEGIFNSALVQRLIPVNPMVGLCRASGAETGRKRIYNAEQTELIKSFAETHRFGLGVILLLETGIRRGELLGLQWGDIDFQDGYIQIRRAAADVVNPETRKKEVILDKPKTKFSEREIPISTDLVSLLTRKHGVFGKNENASEFIVKNSKGGVCSPNTWSKTHYHKFMQEMRAYYLEQNVSIPILNPHECRHTKASLWVNGGKPLYAVAKIMGHADVKMFVKTYAKSTPN
ncbi:site-specific integrase [Clostridia bacterium]|nr:site-specific integrase [Clostridia bacterium]